jgi:hypothetical protein
MRTRSGETSRAKNAPRSIECQAETRPPVRHTGVVDGEVMDEVKNPVPNKGRDY